ncbi:amino acid permease 3-like [Pyrus x bretschneideri]|uniref:amino acid permease 3-like n=1 Tax=Pyrus x bretschneideri TaxID=225117 RepID=UPI00202F9B14|nr:amino acid permease 3-like [Pyrus x bretschneideri]
MGDNQINPRQGFELSVPMPPEAGSKCYDNDGRLKRTGTVWTASARIITAVIGSGVLSLAWATAQLGWVAGPAVMLMFSFVTYYTSTLLSACYRSGDPVTGKRNYTYTDAVRSNLGGFKVKVCGLVQYLNLLFGVAISYTIASSKSMVAIKRSNCFYKNGDKAPCHVNSNPYTIAFGVAEIIFSQIPDFDQLWWLSIVAAVMSFTYSSIGLGLGIATIVETGTIRGSMTGIDTETVTETEKIWRRFQAVGDIASAYSYSLVLIEIQDTLKSPPSEAKIMKKATLVSVSTTTLFYMLCGCMGYAAFGDSSPRNLLTGFGFFNPYWLIDIANAAIVIHLIGAYQVSVQPLYAFVEKTAKEKYPHSQFITKDIKFRIPVFGSYNLNLFRLVWRTSFVIVTTVISMILPFFNDVVGLLGALGFWPLTVYFPVEMYIAQKRIPKWSTRWLCLQILNAACFIITIAVVAGSIAAVISDLKIYKPFKTSY